MVKLTPKQQSAAKYFRIILACYSLLIAACVVVGGFGVTWALGYSVLMLLACFLAGKEDAKLAFRGARLGALGYAVVLAVSMYRVFRCLVLNSSKCEFLYTYAAMLACTGAAIAATVLGFRRASTRRKEEVSPAAKASAAPGAPEKKRLASYRKLDDLDMDKLKAMVKPAQSFKAPENMKPKEEKEREKKEKEDEKLFLEGVRERIKEGQGAKAD